MKYSFHVYFRNSRIRKYFKEFITRSELLSAGLEILQKVQNGMNGDANIIRSPFLAEIFLYNQLLVQKSTLLKLLILGYRQNEIVSNLMLKYTDRFASLPIFFEDVKPFLDYLNPISKEFILELEKKVDPKVFRLSIYLKDVSIANIRKHINVQKIIYYFSTSESFETKQNMILGWIDMYKKSLSLGILPYAYYF